MMEQAFRENGCEVVDASAIMREVRCVKSAKEIEYIEEGVRIADIGHQAIMEKLRPGMTELEINGEAIRAMLAAGGECPAMILLINSLPVVNGIAPWLGHDMATRKKIKKGELLSA
jgi:Xaa-Pro aminopeptidase